MPHGHFYVARHSVVAASDNAVDGGIIEELALDAQRSVATDSQIALTTVDVAGTNRTGFLLAKGNWGIDVDLLIDLPNTVNADTRKGYDIIVYTQDPDTGGKTTLVHKHAKYTRYLAVPGGIGTTLSFKLDAPTVVYVSAYARYRQATNVATSRSGEVIVYKREGAQGPKGEEGTAGTHGTKGEQGEQGEKGDMGERGQRGSDTIAGAVLLTRPRRMYTASANSVASTITIAPTTGPALTFVGIGGTLTGTDQIMAVTSSSGDNLFANRSGGIQLTRDINEIRFNVDLAFSESATGTVYLSVSFYRLRGGTMTLLNRDDHGTLPNRAADWRIVEAFEAYDCLQNDIYFVAISNVGARARDSFTVGRSTIIAQQIGGVRGNDGDHGDKGAPGEQGSPGQKGEIGTKGDAGAFALPATDRFTASVAPSIITTALVTTAGLTLVMTVELRDPNHKGTWVASNATIGAFSATIVAGQSLVFDDVIQTQTLVLQVSASTMRSAINNAGHQGAIRFVVTLTRGGVSNLVRCDVRHL